MNKIKFIFSLMMVLAALSAVMAQDSDAVDRTATEVVQSESTADNNTGSENKIADEQKSVPAVVKSEPESQQQDTASPVDGAEEQAAPAVQETRREPVQAEKKEEVKQQEPAVESEIEIRVLGHIIKKNDPLFEYYIGYGGFFPVSDYEEHYDPGHLVTAGIGLYRYNLWGLAPEVLFRYTRMESTESDSHPDSFFDLYQVSLGIVYRYEFDIHPKARKMCVSARITEGVTIVNFKEEDRNMVQEEINTLGVSAGLSYPVWNELRLGFDFGYRIVFTAGDLMQGLMLNFVVSYRY